MSIKISTEPSIEPVTLSEIKDHLHIESNDHDGELIALIKQARHHVERVTGRALITQTWTMTADYLSTAIHIPRPPLQSITSIQYQDSADAQQTLSSALYVVDTQSEPGRVYPAYNASYPDTYGEINAVTITFVAGYGSAASDVPETFKQAIKLYCEKMFDMPGGAYGESLDNALNSLLFNHRVDNVALA